MRTSSTRGSSTDALYSTDEDRDTARSAASNRSRVAFSSEPLGRTSFSTIDQRRGPPVGAETRYPHLSSAEAAVNAAADAALVRVAAGGRRPCSALRADGLGRGR